MQDAQKKEVITILKVNNQIEERLADFYSACAFIWSDTRLMFEHIAAQEKGHVEIIHRIIELVEEGADITASDLASMYSVDTARTTLKLLIDSIHLLRIGKISQKKALEISLALENSVLEKQVFFVLDGCTDEYCRLRDTILSETNAHVTSFQNALKKLSYK